MNATTATLRRTRPTPLVASLVGGAIAVGFLTSYAFQRNTIHADSVAAHTPPKKVFPGGPAFVRLPLESAEMVNHNTRKLKFKLQDDNSISGLPLPSALLTASWPQGHWFPVARPYTPISSSNEKGFIELLVKKYPNGKQSTHLHNLQHGDSLLFVAAIPGYKWKPNAYPRITLIAGGAGITPIYQLASGILRNPEEKTSMTLVFGVNSDDDVLFRKEFQQFERDFPGRFKAVYTVSNPKEGSELKRGHVTKELLEEVAPKSDMVFVCGPPAMEKALTGGWGGRRGVLQELGYRKDQIHKF